MTRTANQPAECAAAIVVTCRDSTGAVLDGSDLRRVLPQLSSLGVHVAFVVQAPRPEVGPPIGDLAPGPGRLLLVGDGDRAHALRELWRSEGVGASEVQFLTLLGRPDEHGSARGSPSVLDALRAQVARRRRLGVPATPGQPGWVVDRAGNGLPDPAGDSLLTLGAGGLASRGVREGRGLRDPARPTLLAAGVYQGRGSEERLLPGPDWTDLEPACPRLDDDRRLDLRTGVLTRRASACACDYRSLRFASIEYPGVHAVRVEGACGESPGRAAPAGRVQESGPSETEWRSTRGTGGVGVLIGERRSPGAAPRSTERLAAVTVSRRGDASRASAEQLIERAQRLGFDALLAQERRAWSRRWSLVDVRLPDDLELELGLRFSLFQLWSLVGGATAELAVGARGVSGDGYHGHVFWDADVFVLPALMTLDADAARAMVGYRVARLGAARRRARASGHRGARFPWESGTTGGDVTPLWGAVGGRALPVRTGAYEEHVTADVAWAVVEAARWDGRDTALTTMERRVLCETARYWASRCELEEGRAHIRDVIGPDEYHERVDDNAYTNVMARWNLRAAAERGGRSATPGERAAWRDLSERLVDGYDPVTGVHEQFAGYFRLDPALAAQVAAPPVAADVLLGRARVERTQLVKQPDVLMLHHLVPEELRPGSLAADADFYLPRTTHGSTLSPAITAAVLARAGRTVEAGQLLRLAGRIDLDDLSGTTAAGLHLGACGGAWQGFLRGFLGVRVRGGVLHLDPRLDPRWRTVEVRFLCLGAHVRVVVEGEAIEVTADRELPVRLGGRAETLHTPCRGGVTSHG